MRAPSFLFRLAAYGLLAVLALPLLALSDDTGRRVVLYQQQSETGVPLLTNRTPTPRATPIPERDGVPMLTNKTPEPASPTPAPRGTAIAKSTAEGKSGPRRLYKFSNFNGDDLLVEAAFAVDAVEKSVAEFGMRESDRKALKNWYTDAQRSAIDSSNKKMISGTIEATSQAELDRKVKEIKRHNKQVSKDLDKELKRIDQEFERRENKLYADAGFAIRGDVIVVDMPKMVRRNSDRVAPLAVALHKQAKTRVYKQSDVVGAVTALVQTALDYKIPPSKVGDRQTGGMLTPPQSLDGGWGDCDTKTAVAASVLSRWDSIDMLGVAIPGHYLMAIRAVPGPGDVYVEYRGVPYVLIETAGPAWLRPGKVGDQTRSYLKTNRTLRLEKLN